ncbi:hypothetical protein AVEN_162901-1 [Araneus ventricosus]|uniref:Uncharacterized protein n=1 Tax=Araneus ventricosus TaxID=182803 RepID=A0A4Y2UCD7_ARAVE|nr:hypothetical protein AVEN_162901-1 [Araneus ventricosus]
MSFTIRSTACVCEGNLINPCRPLPHRPVSSSEVYENCRRCDITSLSVNEISVVCSSKVNNWNIESTNTITIWINFHCLDNSPSSRDLIWHLSLVNKAKSMFSGAPK